MFIGFITWPHLPFPASASSSSSSTLRREPRSLTEGIFRTQGLADGQAQSARQATSSAAARTVRVFVAGFKGARHGVGDDKSAVAPSEPKKNPPTLVPSPTLTLHPQSCPFPRSEMSHLLGTGTREVFSVEGALLPGRDSPESSITLGIDALDLLGDGASKLRYLPDHCTCYEGH
ncbi:unnamed protein product [Pleuronectes platessa]|uniref:Uncharacterized protein n=1 Tax=Pleuronectes platessa TaxID=8262 RepID=A0A9N7URL5_PLEPL|nr:unnamed protein product [Pleuronectes platessa]